MIVDKTRTITYNGRGFEYKSKYPFISNDLWDNVRKNNFKKGV